MITTTIYIVIAILVLINPIAKAYQDDAVRDGEVAESSYSKYAKNEYGQSIEYDGNSWWYLGLYTPRFKEKFPLSTTWLVWTTDRWHLMGTIRDSSLVLAISIALFSITFKAILVAAAIKIVTATIFHIIFNKI